MIRTLTSDTLGKESAEGPMDAKSLASLSLSPQSNRGAAGRAPDVEGVEATNPRRECENH